jgi:hypothetical protein
MHFTAKALRTAKHKMQSFAKSSASLSVHRASYGKTVPSLQGSNALNHIGGTKKSQSR